MFRPSLTLAVVVLPLVLTMGAGCKKKGSAIDAGDMNTTTTTRQPVADADAMARDMEQLRVNFEKVHFQVDQSDLDPAAQQALRDNARILSTYSTARIEIQGHADERGTTDYNLALGSRRAESVKAFLLAQGVDAGQLRTVSYGEERPAASGSTLVAWAANRRAEFRILQAPSDPNVQIQGTIGN